ncbi:hypothetical protein PENTCL1PPCAC_18140 [Pristionchus entomophagus]|uniref:LRAT domain-containing protein n=1 Tax=Pristionchus entomophagus TaxID=358040 RepID=A0AAV5TNK4_9BILA|nr:hypothetical protein PENTCL1PPCAC_18140 [Pristionchus entomophagus]
MVSFQFLWLFYRIDRRMEQSRSTVAQQVDHDGRGDEERRANLTEPESMDDSFKSCDNTEVITLGDSPLKDEERSDLRQMVCNEIELCTHWMEWEELAVRLTLADLIEFRRVVNIGSTKQRVYTHWAIYVGTLEGLPRIVHLSTENGDFDAMPTSVSDSLPAVHAKIMAGNDAEVRSDSLESAADGDLVRINNGDDARVPPLIREIAVHRATLKLGTRDYHILNNNCEHFVKWCRYGRVYSGQATLVKTLMVGSGVLATTALVAPGAVSTLMAVSAMAAYSTAAVVGRQIDQKKDGSRLLKEEYPPVKREKIFGLIGRSKIIEKVNGGRRMAVDMYKAFYRAMRNKRSGQRMLTGQ